MKKNLFTLLGCFVILLISFNSSKAQYYQINEGFESVSFPLQVGPPRIYLVQRFGQETHQNFIRVQLVHL